MRDFWFAALYSFLEKEDIEQLQKKKKKRKKKRAASITSIYLDILTSFSMVTAVNVLRLKLYSQGNLVF